MNEQRMTMQYINDNGHYNRHLNMISIDNSVTYEAVYLRKRRQHEHKKNITT